MQLAGYLNWVRIERIKNKVSFLITSYYQCGCLRITQCFSLSPKLSKIKELGVGAK
jgi:hypothetical protein